MDVNKIIGDYEAAIEKKKAAEKDRQEEARRQKAMNGKLTEDHIRSVIMPVFEKASEGITASGYPAEVVTISRKTAGPEKTNAENVVGIRMDTQRERADAPRQPPEKSYIKYEGGFERQELVRETYVEGIGKPPQKSPAFVLQRVAAADIDRDVETFLKKVFNATE